MYPAGRSLPHKIASVFLVLSWTFVNTFRSLALQRPTYRRRSYVASVSTEIPEVGWDTRDTRQLEV